MVHDISRPQNSSLLAKKTAKKQISAAASSAMAALATTKIKSTNVSNVTSETTLDNILKPKERIIDMESLEAQLKVNELPSYSER